SCCWTNRSAQAKCLLVFTSVLLLCEIVVGRLCNSLINTVDSFHTLYNNHTEDRYSTLRMQPFGAAVSALLLGSLCVSISLEIITHTLQPHVIKHPLLATAVGAASLLFNTLILIWRKMDIGLGGINKELTETQSEAFTTTNDKGSMLHINSQQGGGSTTEVEEAVHHDHSTQEGPLHDGALMFCNPGAPSVLDPGHWNQGYMNSIVVVMHGLLGSVLVLVNGLALLLFGADCLQPHWVCHLLPYLDPVFSLATVLVLIARALPELRHHALMLLQAPPAHVHVEELTASIGRVPGVLAIHELHVWQLSEARLVASVHVHCPSGMGALECSELLVMVTEVLKSFGVSRCTVQPEFVAIHSDDPQSHAGSPYCSLRCGKECARKMCCAPPEVQQLNFKSNKVQISDISTTFIVSFLSLEHDMCFPLTHFLL
uniref:Solute carrier family 30 member 1b n=1 Tax=Pygocentrus nattereri TaxID=42514 RepID=A0AAR2JY73_PYGNA